MMGTAPTRRQKILISAAWLDYRHYLIIHDRPDDLIIIRRGETDRTKAKIISKEDKTK